jgi:hypothetical protein
MKTGAGGDENSPAGPYCFSNSARRTLSAFSFSHLAVTSRITAAVPAIAPAASLMIVMENSVESLEPSLRSAGAAKSSFA